jgi:MOSC domain-containing protein YiiM
MARKLQDGRIRTIFVRPQARGDVKTLEEGKLIAGKGLEGDRYADGKGSFSKATRASNLTLVAIEDLEHVARTTGVPLSAEESLRNLVTEGVDLTTLLHRRFQLGDAVCVGTRLCEPCTVLEDYTGRTGLLRPYVHRTGLRAQVLESGAIHVGDAVVDLGPAQELMTTLSAPTTGRGVFLRQPDGAYFCGECESPSGNPRGNRREATCLRCGMRGPIRRLEDMPWDDGVKAAVTEKMRRFPYSPENLATETGLSLDAVRAMVTYLKLTDNATLYARVARLHGNGLDFDDRFSQAALDRIQQNLGILSSAREQFQQRAMAAAAV